MVVEAQSLVPTACWGQTRDFPIMQDPGKEKEKNREGTQLPHYIRGEREGEAGYMF